MGIPIRNFDTASIITLSVLSLFVIPTTIHLSTVDEFSDERFFLNASNYALGKSTSTVKTRWALKTDKDYFEPDMNQISRVMKILLEKNSVGKTNLSLEANINYVRLSRILEWLEEKRFIELVIEEGKVCIKLSRMGKDFAMMLSMLL